LILYELGFGLEVYNKNGWNPRRPKGTLPGQAALAQALPRYGQDQSHHCLHSHRLPQLPLPRDTSILIASQHFQHLLGDRRARYMAWLTYLDVFMCLLSYWQTIRIGNLVPKLSRLEPKGPPTEKFYDYEYSPTHKGCTICQNFKFPRVHHCSTCGSCQYKMDHHCIWTQTCIGYSNQKSFYLFCFYMSIGVFQFWYFSYRVVSERIGSFWHLVEPGVMILWGFTTLSVFFVGLMIIVLFISHTIMMLTNHSTLDSMKAKKMCPMPFCQKGPSPSSINLFDRGELQNLKLFLGRDWWLWLIPTAREIENEIYP